MKVLSLYIEKWYIVGAVIDDSGPHALTLPNGEKRLWLYFYNDTEAGSVRYSLNYKAHALAGEPGYYANIFDLIPTTKELTFSSFGRPVDMCNIFGYAGVWNDLRASFAEGERVPTYLSFSSGISLVSQSIFMDLLREAGFEVKEYVAHVEKLALEYAYRRKRMSGATKVLVLNACSENLKYALYERIDGQFIQRGNDRVLLGLGEDTRKHAIVEQVIETLNAATRFLTDDADRKEEYLFLSQDADRWLRAVDANLPGVPTPLGYVHFKKQANNIYPVSVLKKDIDNRTAVITDDIVRQVTRIVSENGVATNEVSHVLLLGDTFGNSQYVEKLKGKFALTGEKYICLREEKLADVVGIYQYLPETMFEADEKTFEQLSEAQRHQAQQTKAEQEAMAVAKQQEAQAREERRKQREQKQRLANARAQGQRAERQGKLDEALTFYRQASQLAPDDDMLKDKVEELNEKIVEDKAKSHQYNVYIRKAKETFHNHQWEEATTQSNLALGVRPDSVEARDILTQAQEQQAKYVQLEKHLIKLNTLIDHDNYNEAQDEIDRAQKLGLKDQRLTGLAAKVEQKRQAIAAAVLKESEAFAEDRSAHRYDEAISHARELLNLDKTHTADWQNAITEVSKEKAREQIKNQRLAALAERIEAAKKVKNWQQVSDLCDRSLAIQDDSVISRLKEKARKEVELKNRKQTAFAHPRHSSKHTHLNPTKSKSSRGGASKTVPATTLERPNEMQTVDATDDIITNATPSSTSGSSSMPSAEIDLSNFDEDQAKADHQHFYENGDLIQAIIAAGKLATFYIKNNEKRKATYWRTRVKTDWNELKNENVSVNDWERCFNLVLQAQETALKDYKKRYEQTKAAILYAKDKNDWDKVVTLCNNYLTHHEDADIRRLMDLAHNVLYVENKAVKFNNWDLVIRLVEKYPDLQGVPKVMRYLKEAKKIINEKRISSEESIDKDGQERHESKKGLFSRLFSSRNNELARQIKNPAKRSSKTSLANPVSVRAKMVHRTVSTITPTASTRKSIPKSERNKASQTLTTGPNKISSKSVDSPRTEVKQTAKSKELKKRKLPSVKRRN